MALLGKTLKGRTTRPGGFGVKRNIKIRQISKTQDEFDQNAKLGKIKRDILKAKMAEEEQTFKFNKKKLLTYWRKIMRIAKTEQLKNEIDIISQNNQRELDSKEAFLQMLDKNIEEAEEQFQIALRNHLIHLDHLLQLQDYRLRGLNEEFTRDVKILEEEFDIERKLMIQNYQQKETELEDMIETVKDEEKKKAEEANNKFQAFREETRNKNQEDQSSMKMLLDTLQTKYYHDLEQLHSKYTSDTAKKTEEHGSYFDSNKSWSKQIDIRVRNIANKRSKIDLMRLKILQHSNECKLRNQALRKEKENIIKNYQELKNKMTKFRDEESKRLTELSNNSRNAVIKLKEYHQLGEKILKTAELSRRLETEKEKVLPFYESTIDEDEIPEDLKKVFGEITEEQLHEFSYLKNFYKRYNKVLLDKLAIQKQKQALSQDNQLLKNLLKQYLDGISLNDDVLKQNNPLLIFNNKINIQRPPVEANEIKTTIEGAIEVTNNALQRNGGPLRYN